MRLSCMYQRAEHSNRARRSVCVKRDQRFSDSISVVIRYNGSSRSTVNRHNCSSLSETP